MKLLGQLLKVNIKVPNRVNTLFQKIKYWFTPYLPSEDELFDKFSPTVNHAISVPGYLEKIEQEHQDVAVVLNEQFSSLEGKANLVFKWFLGVHSLFIANLVFLTKSDNTLAYLDVS